MEAIYAITSLLDLKYRPRAHSGGLASPAFYAVSLTPVLLYLGLLERVSPALSAGSLSFL